MKPKSKARAASVSSTETDRVLRSGATESSAADQLLYRTLIDSLTDYAMFAVAPDGRIISWNAGAEKTFGYTAQEILGHSFAAIFTAEDVAAGAPQNEL